MIDTSQRGFGRFETLFVLGAGLIIALILGLTLAHALHLYRSQSRDRVLRAAHAAVEDWARTFKRTETPNPHTLVMGRRFIRFTTIHHVTYLYGWHRGGFVTKSIDGGPSRVLAHDVARLRFTYWRRNGKSPARTTLQVRYVEMTLTVVHDTVHKSYTLIVAPRAFT